MRIVNKRRRLVLTNRLTRIWRQVPGVPSPPRPSLTRLPPGRAFIRGSGNLAIDLVRDAFHHLPNLLGIYPPGRSGHFVAAYYLKQDPYARDEITEH